MSKTFTAAALLLALGLALIPASIASQAQLPAPPAKFFRTAPQAASVRYWVQHPDRAPAELKPRLTALREGEQPAASTAAAAAAASTAAGAPTAAFNRDSLGLPQNSEAVGACRSNPNVVLGGANDFRGLLRTFYNFTGWYVSTDGGATLANEGLLPIAPSDDGNPMTPAGDPAVAIGKDCSLYMATVAWPLYSYDGTSAALYKSDQYQLASCPGGTDVSCWPGRKQIDSGLNYHEVTHVAIDVGDSGAAGEVVWAAYSQWEWDEETYDWFASILTVRCKTDLSACSAPAVLARANEYGSIPVFPDLTVGPNGRVYVSWTDVGFTNDGSINLTHRVAVAPAGSTSFGPGRAVATETKPLAGYLHANDFTGFTLPKSTVAMVDGKPRIFVVWEGCGETQFYGWVCVEPRINLRYSDDEGKTWAAKTVSAGGDNYFPTLSYDRSTGRLVVAWYTNRNDPGGFHNAQTVEVSTLNAKTLLPAAGGRRTVTVPNETEADPFLGGFWIGDYFDVFAHGGTAYVHYNANYRSERLFGHGFYPLPQQDNFLAKVAE